MMVVRNFRVRLSEVRSMVVTLGDKETTYGMFIIKISWVSPDADTTYVYVDVYDKYINRHIWGNLVDLEGTHITAYKASRFAREVMEAVKADDINIWDDDNGKMTFADIEYIFKDQI